MAVSHAKTLRHMKHRIQTTAGLSPDHIQSTSDKPLEGVEKGNGCGPKSWLTNNKVVGEAYQSITKAGITISDPTGQYSFFQWKISYVDDNKLLFELQDIDFSVVPDIEELIKDLECWAYMIHTSGGEISWPKSWYQLITWKLEKGIENSELQKNLRLI